MQTTRSTSVAAVSAVSLLLLLVSPGCGGKDATPTKTPEPSTEPQSTGGETKKDEPKSDKPYTYFEMKLAKDQMKVYCSTCHGTSGKADTPTGKALTPRPRDWTNAEWQDKVDDQHIFNVIMDGGAKHGLSAAMAPIESKYQKKPGVIWALVKLVRDFKGK